MAGLSVFLVEDNQKIRDHLIPALADLGSASVIAIAQSEPEAIAWLARHKGQWDLAVVDLFLEEGNGLGVVDWCRGREPHQRVAVLTNYATDTMRKACLEAGADAFFDKSTELEAFFEFCLDSGQGERRRFRGGSGQLRPGAADGSEPCRSQIRL